MVTPLAVGTEETWRHIVAGDSAVAPIRGFDASALRCQIAGEVRDLDAKAFECEPDIPFRDQLGIAATSLAMADAGLDRFRNGAALYLGTNDSVPDMEEYVALADGAARSDAAAGIDAHWPLATRALSRRGSAPRVESAALAATARTYGACGIAALIAGTEDASAMAICRAQRAIRRGEADCAIAGGFDDPITWWQMPRWDAVGVLTHRNDLGSAACRPYDRARTGTVLGQGAVMLVLEEREVARERGAHVYAEIAGIGSSFSTHSLVTPDPEGGEVATAISMSLADGGLVPEDIEYISAHGAATILGDRTDARGIRRALGAHADRVTASSVKPATSHLLAAAGALNVVIAALVLRDGVAPPTLNLDNLEPRCLLDWVPKVARPVRARHTLAIARGFEGQTVALALSPAS